MAGKPHRVWFISPQGMYKLTCTSRTPEAEAFTDWAAVGTIEGAMTQTRAHKRYRCRFCGITLPAWLPVAKHPDGAMLLYHLSQQHPDQVGTYLERMRTEDIGTVAAEAYEVMEKQDEAS